MMRVKELIPRFTHFCVEPQSDHKFDVVMKKPSVGDRNTVVINKLFVAAVLSTSGGIYFTVLSRDKPGRQNPLFKYIGHKSEILELLWCPHDPYKIVSVSDDNMALFWKVETMGMTKDVDTPVCQFKASNSIIVKIQWHPSAFNIIFVASIDSISIFNAKNAECIRLIDTSQVANTIYDFSLNYNGSSGAIGFNDGKVRIFNLMNGEIKTEFFTNRGSGIFKVLWLAGIQNDDLITTIGRNSFETTYICMWSISGEGEMLFSKKLEEIYNCSNMYWDVGSRLICLYLNKSDLIRFFEFYMYSDPWLRELPPCRIHNVHQTMSIGSKLCCDMMKNEIIHTVHAFPEYIEEISFLVPNESKIPRIDLFPDTPGEIPATSADDFIAGKVCDPILVTLKDSLTGDNPLGKSSSSKIASTPRYDIDRAIDMPDR